MKYVGLSVASTAPGQCALPANLTQREHWYHICKVLFPELNPPNSPYLDLDSPDFYAKRNGYTPKYKHTRTLQDVDEKVVSRSCIIPCSDAGGRGGGGGAGRGRRRGS